MQTHAHTQLGTHTHIHIKRYNFTKINEKRKQSANSIRTYTIY